MKKHANFIIQHVEHYFIILSLIILIIFFGIASDNFFSSATFFTIINQLPSLIVVTIGMTLVLMTADIDLSVGSVLGLSAGVAGAAVVGLGLPLPVACLLGIIVGATCGFINGSLTSYFSIPSFIVTLGMLEMARGLSYMVTDSQTVYIGPDIQAISLPIDGLGISLALIISLALVFIINFILTRTVLGRHIVAVGTNEKSARMTGINTRAVRIITLTISGCLAGLGGIFNAAYLGSADPNAGLGLELSAIAAAVIGGTSLMGGGEDR